MLERGGVGCGGDPSYQDVDLERDLLHHHPVDEALHRHLPVYIHHLLAQGRAQTPAMRIDGESLGRCRGVKQEEGGGGGMGPWALR